MSFGFNTIQPISPSGGSGGGFELPSGGVTGNFLYKTDLGTSWSTGVRFTDTGSMEMKALVLIDSAETGLQVRYSGDLNDNENISNPIWTLGRLVEGGVADKSVFRFSFSSDSTSDRSVFEVEDTGTVASVSDGTRRSHFEAFLNNGDTQPVFRLSSSVGGNSQMGLQFGAGGNLPTDVEIARWTDNAMYIALGGSIKFFLYPDAFVVQPSVDFVMQNTDGSTSGLVLKEKDINGNNFTRIMGADAISSDYTIKLPDSPPSEGSYMSFTSTGESSFASSIPSSSVAVDNTSFKVLTGTDNQTLWEQNDVALLNARSTGVRYGGNLTDLGSGVVRISAGEGELLNNAIPSDPTYSKVAWLQTDIDLSATNGVHYIYVDNTGSVLSTLTAPSHEDYRTSLWLWRVSVRSNVVSGTTSIVQPIQQYGAQIWDIFRAVGHTKTGLSISAASSDLSVAVSAGEVYEAGSNFYTNPLNPHEKDIPAESPVTFRMVDRNGNQTADLTQVPVGQWDNNGTIEAISGSSSRATIIDCRLFVGSINYRFFYGQQAFNSVSDAQEALFSGVYNAVTPSAYDNSIRIGYIIAEKGATDFSDGVQVFITTNRFGLIGGAQSTSGINLLAVINNLSDLDDPSIALQNLGLTATATELNYMDGVVANVQSQLGNKADVLPIATAPDDLVPIAASVSNSLYSHTSTAYLDRVTGDIIVQEQTGTIGNYIYYRTSLKGNGVDFASYITTLGLTRAGGVIIKPADGDHPDLADYSVKLPAAAPTTGQVLGVSDSNADELVWKSPTSEKGQLIITHTTAPTKGSTNTNVLLFDTTTLNNGGFTVDNSATLGTSVSVPRTGLYHVTFSVFTLTASVSIHAGSSVTNDTNNDSGTARAVSSGTLHNLSMVVSLSAGDLVWFSSSADARSVSGYSGYARAVIVEV